MALVEYAVGGDLGDGVAHIRLNRPNEANSFDLETTREFRAAVDAAGADDQVRSILISGAGPRFCGGGDVASFAAAEDQPAFVHLMAVELDEAFRVLGAMPKPVVAAVQGAVAGAGLALLLTADVAIAAPGTKFVFAYPGIGFTPDCGVSWLLPRAIGSHRALSFALTGQVVESELAQEWGLVAQVDQDPLATATGLAQQWAAGPATALGQVRSLLREGWHRDRETAGAVEADTITEMVRGEEAQRLINAFVAKSSGAK